jgi:hypothetical protein
MAIVLFLSRSCHSECLFSLFPENAFFLSWHICDRIASNLVLFYVTILLTTLVKFVTGKMCHIYEILGKFFQLTVRIWFLN